MNDFHESVWIDVFDEERISTGYMVLPEYAESDQAAACRVCTIMATAIGRELADVFEQEKAEKTAEYLLAVILGEIRLAKTGETSAR